MTPRVRLFAERSVSVAEIPPFPWRIGPADRIAFAGSCFAAHLHRYWRDRFLPGELSPFGNTYNPESLKEAVSLLLSGRRIGEAELFCHRDLWRHSLFDTLHTSPDKEELLGRLNKALEAHRAFMGGCGYIVLTLGTAWVYREKATGKTVNNCHTRPGGEFLRRCLSLEEIAACLEEVCRSLSAFAPGIRFILSLSPVRHLKDGALENSLSKALLRCALDRIVREREEAFYFPAYEIMTDELRDYRWYAEDLVHPSDSAAAYIMDRFREAAGAEELETYMVEAEKLRNRMEHRLRFPSSPEGQRFREAMERDKAAFRKRYDFARMEDLPPS